MWLGDSRIVTRKEKKDGVRLYRRCSTASRFSLFFPRLLVYSILPKSTVTIWEKSSHQQQPRQQAMPQTSSLHWREWKRNFLFSLCHFFIAVHWYRSADNLISACPSFCVLFHYYRFEKVQYSESFYLSLIVSKPTPHQTQPLEN